MNESCARRMRLAKPSFIRQILKVAQQPEVISFAGGLPNAGLFPIKAMSELSARVVDKYGERALQYSTTEGFPPLRDWIVERYRKHLDIGVENIMITTGSQQGLDLIGKVMLDPGDVALVESPGYLGALQSFALFEPEFVDVPVDQDGMQVSALEQAAERQAKLLYTVPNFQNPSGVTYSSDRRQLVADVVNRRKILLVEDDPYGELRYSGTALPPVSAYGVDRFCLLGSFSKTVAPGLRLGSVCAPSPLIDKLTIVKQAADLHTSIFNQLLLYEYLVGGKYVAHIEELRNFYAGQLERMSAAIKSSFPKTVTVWLPEGGMFIWLELPDSLTSMALYERTAKRNVVFVPGDPFYTDGRQSRCFRLNFSTPAPESIDAGIAILAEEIFALLDASKQRHSA